MATRGPGQDLTGVRVYADRHPTHTIASSALGPITQGARRSCRCPGQSFTPALPGLAHPQARPEELGELEGWTPRQRRRCARPQAAAADACYWPALVRCLPRYARHRPHRPALNPSGRPVRARRATWSIGR
jgi:hypothetical protein